MTRAGKNAGFPAGVEFPANDPPRERRFKRPGEGSILTKMVSQRAEWELVNRKGWEVVKDTPRTSIPVPRGETS